MAKVRVTVAVGRVLREFLTDTSRARYGYDLMQSTGYPSGKLYPILAKLVKAGWLTRDREDVDEGHVGRPTRYLYRLTEHGAAASAYELAEIAQQLSPPILDPHPAQPRLRSQPHTGDIRT